MSWLMRALVNKKTHSVPLPSPQLESKSILKYLSSFEISCPGHVSGVSAMQCFHIHTLDVF